MPEIIALSYEESRLEFFEELKKQHEQKLHWWKNQKPYSKGYKHCDPMRIHDECSYHGAAIQYCEDAIKALNPNPVRHGQWIQNDTPFVRQRKCSLCGHNDNQKTAIWGHYCWYCGAKMDGGTSNGSVGK